ncbi:MAG: DUF4391 domain-containing protein [Gemmatimonadaceae bacterium]|nr:DUF4391 domain-containing protein [Gemmatimonadaceae bacterium]
MGCTGSSFTRILRFLAYVCLGGDDGIVRSDSFVVSRPDAREAELGTAVALGGSARELTRSALDGAVEPATLHLPPALVERDFVSSLGLALEGAHDLWALYDGWIARAQALAAARVTGRFVLLGDAERRQARREAMARYAAVRQELEALRLAAGRERQLNKRVELNLTIQRLEQELAGLLERL